MRRRSPLRSRRLAVVVGLLAPLALVVVPPAQASVAPSDPSFQPVSGDLIGVGSDVTQEALHEASEAYSRGRLPGTRVASFAASGAGQIVLPSGAVPRPNGSAAGKRTLFGPGENPDVDFARAASTLTADEVGAGLWQIPFAQDIQVMVVANDSHAPARLTRAQVLDIYQGRITDWSVVGGTPGRIRAFRPQDGSATSSFFRANLRSANGGTDITFGQDVATTAEQDDTDLRSDPDAIVPMSLRRAQRFGTLRVLGADTSGGSSDFAYARAVYDVVRDRDVDSPEVRGFFGPDGYLCSPAARELIRAGGLDQLATPTRGGECGVPRRTPLLELPTPVADEPGTVELLPVPASFYGRTVRLAARASGSGITTSSRVRFVETVDGFQRELGAADVVGGTAILDVLLDAGRHRITALLDDGGVSSPSVEVLVRRAAFPVTPFASRTYGESSSVYDYTTPAGIGIESVGPDPLVCRRVNGGRDLEGPLNAGAYRIAGASCSGFVLTGPGKDNYRLTYRNGDLVVRKAPITVTTGSTSRAVSLLQLAVTYTTTVRSAVTGRPIAGVPVRVQPSGRPASAACDAVTDRHGVATCRGDLLSASPDGGFTASVPERANYLAGSAQGSTPLV